jgi:hypothetical protein
MLRFDAAIARHAMTQVRNGKMRDFMPWPREEEVEATEDNIAALLTSVAARNKKKPNV